MSGGGGARGELVITWEVRRPQAFLLSGFSVRDALAGVEGVVADLL